MFPECPNDQALLAALAPEQAAVPADEKDPTPEAVAAAIAASGGQVSAGGGPTRPPAAPTAPAPTVSFLLPGGDFLAPAEEKQVRTAPLLVQLTAAVSYSTLLVCTLLCLTRLYLTVTVPYGTLLVCTLL
jgi:hypothetical protein